MREQHVALKTLTAVRRDHLRRHARQIAVVRAILGPKDEGRQRRPALTYRESKLPGYVIAESCRPHLRNRESSGGDDYDGRVVVGFSGGDDIFGSPPNLTGPHVQENRNTGGMTLLLEHGGDVARGTIAEQLAESLLMIGNTMLFDQREKVLWCVARQRRFAEVWIRR
jgi:hypothetical protein